MVDGKRLVKRLFLFLIIGALAVVAVIYAVRIAQKTSNAAITTLLPRDTIALVHIPDFNKTRNDWQRSDLYQLYAEPAVQEFLRHPIRRTPKKESLAHRSEEIERLDPKEAFIALTSMANDQPKVVAGFRFRASQDDAETIIAGWRSHLLGPASASKRETVDYQKHKIDIFGGGLFTLALVYDGSWFFAANDLDEVKALLDRADGRVPAPASPSSGGQDRQSLLGADETFRAAMAEMPASYALGFYLQPKILAEKIAALRNAPDQRTMLEQMRSICATTRFDNGKIHDVIFVTMPRFEQNTALTRDSLALGTKDTFLYVASLLNLSRQFALLNSSGAGGVLGGGLNKIADALARAQIRMEDWTAAFGSEVGALADWPPNAHWPSGVVAFPVKDFERAKKIASVLAHASDHDAVWRETDRNGVHYLTMQSAPGFLVLRPTIAITNAVMIAGLDPGSVVAAADRSASPASGLAKSAAYRNAAQTLPAPTNFFAYVDLALLYSRLDATLRPIMMMGAAFMPGVNEHVDLSRVPSAEVVAKHLSPIVSSQRYKDGGYLTESIGPVTLNQSGIALVALSIAGAKQAGWANPFGGLGGRSLVVPPASVPASPPAKPTNTP